MTTVPYPLFELVGPPCKNKSCRGVLTHCLDLIRKSFYDHCSICNTKYYDGDYLTQQYKERDEIERLHKYPYDGRLFAFQTNAVTTTLESLEGEPGTFGRFPLGSLDRSYGVTLIDPKNFIYCVCSLDQNVKAPQGFTEFSYSGLMKRNYELEKHRLSNTIKTLRAPDVIEEVGGPAIQKLRDALFAVEDAMYPKTNESTIGLKTLDNRLMLLHDLRDLFYAQNDCSCGGPLHILLDDSNMDNSDIEFCRKELSLEKWLHVRELGTAILDMLSTLSVAQRLGWWHHDDVKDILALAGKDVIRVPSDTGHLNRGYVIYRTEEEWIAEELRGLGLTKAVCYHCGNDDPKLMAHNWYFTHGGGHKALNYQCHNRPACGNYFKIGPISQCSCGWTKRDADRMEKEGKEWTWNYGSYAWRKAPEGTTWTYLGNGEWDWREKK